jgi:hypothetical protein
MSTYTQPTNEDVYKGAELIQNCMKEKRPFFIGRNGTIETETLYFYITRRGECVAENGDDACPPYPRQMTYQMEMNAGIFPGTDATLDDWCKTYLESMGELDGAAAGWYAPLFSIDLALINRFAKKGCFRTPLRSLEPYYSPSQLWWTKELAGKEICVVSSFADTIQKQVDSGAASSIIWRGEQKGLLDIPGASWSYVRSGYAPNVALGRGGWPPGIRNWKDAVDYMEKQVLATKATVALIGCGALGLILGARLKRRGISSILLGGAIQVLFGIKGRRWQKHDVISKFWNPFWVWPAPEEVPGAANFIEGGCYWGNGAV